MNSLFSLYATAVGWAYAQKRAGKSLVTACFLGESTTSAGDSHAGFNFAAVLDTPVVFIWSV